MSRAERKKQANEAENKTAKKTKRKANGIKNKWTQFKGWFNSQAKWKRVLMVTCTVIVVLLLVAAIAAYALFSSIFGDMFKESEGEYDLSLKAVDGYYNILLLGVDSRNMDDVEGTRSDAIMVVSISEDTSDVKILSVYRDTYLKLGETTTYDKITHACVYGGPEMTMKSLNQALDLDISNYVVVNFKVVADVVDAVGGIEVDVEDYEIQQLNKYTIATANNIGRDDYQLVESAGKQTLDGCQAVSYSRIRKGVGDDFKRTERMRTVVSLTVEKMKDMSFKELRKLIKVITPQVQTNISKSNVLGLAFRLPQYNIVGTQGWPFNVTTGYVGGVSYVFPSDLAANTVKMHQDFFGQTEYQPSDMVNEISNTIIANLNAERAAGNIEKEDSKEIDTGTSSKEPVKNETPKKDEPVTTPSGGNSGNTGTGDSGNTGTGDSTQTPGSGNESQTPGTGGDSQAPETGGDTPSGDGTQDPGTNGDSSAGTVTPETGGQTTPGTEK